MTVSIQEQLRDYADQVTSQSVPVDLDETVFGDPAFHPVTQTVGAWPEHSAEPILSTRRRGWLIAVAAAVAVLVLVGGAASLVQLTGSDSPVADTVPTTLTESTPTTTAKPGSEADASEVLAYWVDRALAADVEAASSVVTSDAGWAGIGASADVFVEGAGPFGSSIIESSCNGDVLLATCVVSWTDRWIAANPNLDQGTMRVTAQVEDGQIVAFRAWSVDNDVLNAFRAHLSWLEDNQPRRHADTCAIDTGAVECSILLVDTVDLWLATAKPAG